MRPFITVQKRTIEQYINSMISNPEALLARLDAGAFDFTIRATSYAKDAFVDSFSNGGFYKQGKWAPLKKANKTGNTLIETGELMDLESETKMKRKRFTGRISTTEKRGNRKGKKKIGYAAVHNDPLSSYTVNQYSSRAPIQRQFMGHNSALYNEIAGKFSHLIFSKLQML